MKRILFLVCIAGLTLSVSSPAFADDPDGCDMMCRLKGYLATDHMAPGPVETAASRAGSAKHARRAAAAHKSKPAVAAAPAPTAPKAADAKLAPAVTTAKVLPPRSKAVAVADAKPTPSAERHRSTEKAAGRPTKTAIAARTKAAAPQEEAALPVVANTPPKRAATRVATLAAPRASAEPRLRTATATEMTTSPTAPIPGSAPLVAAGFR